MSSTQALAEHLVELWPLERLQPYERNPRLCPQRAIEKVAASIAEFGFRQPIVVDRDGVLIVGHTRLAAAKLLGLARVPVHVAAELSPEQVRAYRLADNRTAQETSWNDELLGAEIADLAASDYDLDLLGFDYPELSALLELAGGQSDPDELPSAPETPLSKPGDLWQLGEHRLLCGDATKAEQVRRLMAGERASLMVTDPPYLVDYDGGNHPPSYNKANRRVPAEKKTKHWDAYRDQESAVDFYRGFLQVALGEALSERPIVYQFYAATRAELVFGAWRAVGLLAHQVLIWQKSRPVLGRCWYQYDYEPFLVGWIAGRRPAARLRPPNTERTIWTVAQRAGTEDGAGHEHPTMKPVELIGRPIAYHTKPGELLYEPFCGSGTTIIAAEIAKRPCYALELSPTFVDVAVTRWQRFTGKEAVRHGARD